MNEIKIEGLSRLEPPDPGLLDCKTEDSTITLPLFHGDSSDFLSIRQHVFIIETVAKSSNWNEVVALDYLKSSIANSSEIPKDWQNTFDDLKRYLFTLFQPKLTTRNKVELRQSLIQNAAENVQQFFNRCKCAQIQLCDQFYSEVLDERELLLTFINGLRSELQDIVIRSEVKSLDSCLEAAIKVETVQASLKTEVMDDIGQEDLDAAFDYTPSDYDGQIEYTNGIDDLPLKQDVETKVEFEELNGDVGEGKVGKFKCKSCGFCYTSAQVLYNHEVNEHAADRKKFSCSICQVTSHSRKYMKLHKQQFHPEKCQKCHICEQTFLTSRKLSHHYSTKHAGQENINTPTCSFCAKKFETQSGLKIHIHNRHVNKKAHACSVCSKTFSTASNLKNHVRIVHLMERPYECLQCNKSYASEGGLAAHEASIHGKGERLQCDQCEMTFPYKSGLTTHILNKHNRGTFICDICGKSNNTKEALRIHKIKEHSDDQGKVIPCPFENCKEMFRVQFQVRAHVKRIHEKVEGTHVCHMCAKKYHSKQRLISHINGVHLNKKPYKCEHCDFATSYQGHVKEHIRATHQSIKFPCPYPACTHASSYKGNLDKHIRNIHLKNSAGNVTL